MTWRGTTTAKDRFFACLPYLLPLASVAMLGVTAALAGIGLFAQFPILQWLIVPVTPLLLFNNVFSFGGFSFGSIIVFLLLLNLVVRNPKISHFIRFNTMQAILLEILMFLAEIILRVIPMGSASLLADTLLNIQ